MRATGKFRQFAILWLAITLTYFLFSAASLLIFRRALATCELPQQGWAGILCLFTLVYPSGKVELLPAYAHELLPWMVLQSLVCGLIISVVIFGPFTIALRRGGMVLRMILVTFCLLFAFAFIGCGIWLRTACNSYSITSERIPALSDRLRILGKFIKIPGTVLDTRYQLFYFPPSVGPSGYEHTIALKVPPNEVDRWHAQFSKRSPNDAPIDPSRWDFLHLSGWVHTSPPEYYTGAHASEIIYRREGILLLHLNR